MPKLQFKYKDEYEKISIKHKSDNDMTTIEWYIEIMCNFLIALGFSKPTIQKYIGFDGEVYEMKQWIEDMEDFDRELNGELEE